MTVLFTHEIHASFIDHEFFNKGGVIGNEALQNYLFSCDNGILVTRCTNEEKQQEGVSYLPLDGNGIYVIPIKEFGVRTLVENYRIVKSNLSKADCFLIRLPGLTGVFVGLILYFHNKRFGVELAGDVVESLFEVYKKPSVLTRFFIKVFSALNKFLIRKAGAVGYRSHALRNAYPNKHKYNEFVFSGAQITSKDVGRAKEPTHYMSTPIKLLYLGRLSAEKGVDHLIEAVHKLKESGFKISLTVVGDGIELAALQNLVKEKILEEEVVFRGKISDRQQVHEIMDQSHIYVIPSITEGMPRALIEAMARGMVAVGSKTGGIPELLSERFLFKPKNVDEIVSKIQELITDPIALSKISQQNIDLSKDHWAENIESVKKQFWGKVIEL